MTSHNGQPVDRQRLDEIEQRLHAATPGPWCHRDQFIETAGTTGQLLGVTMQRNEDGLDQLPGGENACFIAHAREDVELLLAEVARLQSRVEELEQQLGNA